MDGVKVTTALNVRQFKDGVFSNLAKEIIREVPLEIFLNGRKMAVIACSGLHAEELAVGFLRSEGVVHAPGEIERIETTDDGTAVYVQTKAPVQMTLSDHKTIASSGARGIVASVDNAGYPVGGEDAVILVPEEIFRLMEGLLESSCLHSSTGGTHSAALAARDGLIAVREDIGRHNAIDMLGGYALLNGINCADKIIVRTGRVSSEIVHKVRRLGVPVVVSISVPTTTAVVLANEAGITLIGSVRGGKFIVYSHEERIGQSL